MIAIAAFVAAIAASVGVPLSPCVLSHPSGARAYASCGEVPVAIDPAHPDKTLGVGFAVLTATGTNPLPDPIVLLAGGPGQAATRDYVPLLPVLQSLRAAHTLVLLDIRGTGRSQPQSCKDDRPIKDRISDQDVEHAASCAAGLTLDPHFITTRDAARDVDAVRAALGYDSWNVLGVSYGTRLAVVYDQLFPGRARTLILDGVVPLDRALGDDVAVDMSAALRAAGAEVVQNFVELKAQLKAAPRVVKVAHPTTAKRVELEVNADVVNGTVRMLLYADETRALLGPLLKGALGPDGDLVPLVALAISVGEQLEGGIHTPVNVSILCAEDAPFFSDQPSPADAVFEDERPAIRALCAKWPHADAPAPRGQTTKTPTLLLSGEFDPITPPRHAKRSEHDFVDHAHVVVAGMGHGMLARACVEEVVADFVKAGTAAGLDASCTQKIGPFPAFIDAMGPPP